MPFLWEIIQFIVYSFCLVGISKYILVPVLRKLAESLNLKPKTVGNLAGMATSVPELLSVSFAAVSGLLQTSIYNILSSNIINLAQYGISIVLNKNGMFLRNKALIIDLIMVGCTILIPFGILIVGKETNGGMAVIFLLLFAFFYYLNYHMHKRYLSQDEKQVEHEIEEGKAGEGKKSLMIRYFVYLVATGIALFIVGDLLSSCLEKLCQQFGVPEWILGLALGGITSIPELITFFESQKHYRNKQKNRLGVIEATNNLLTSNMLNLFMIQSIGMILYGIIFE